MTKDELKERFRQFSLRIIKLADAMPKTISGIAVAKQIIRSGTSPAANYRAACIAKSDKDFVNKLKIVEEEIDAYVEQVRAQLKQYLKNCDGIQVK